MGPAMDYRSLLRDLPPGIEPGFDGMVLEVPGPAPSATPGNKP
jgi:hypothetical protein